MKHTEDDAGLAPAAPTHDEGRASARRRALSTARAVTLGLATAAAISGCEVTANTYCRVFEHSSYCCTRSGGTWDPAASTCLPPSPFAMPGPFVPPSARA